MSRGFLIFAQNNDQIDYGLIAFCNATMIKHFMPDASVGLVTDAGTIGWLRTARGTAAVDKAFDHIITLPDESRLNASHRRFADGDAAFSLPWFNRSRVDAYNITPYDETILLDCDYLIANDRLSLCWGHHESIMINRGAVRLDRDPLDAQDTRLSPAGIPMYWATCVYFRKSTEAAALFDLVSHVREHYEFFRRIYDFAGGLYRNDFAFSVAVHMLNGYSSRSGLVSSLPTPRILTAFGRDDLIDVPAPGEFTFLVNSRKQEWAYKLNRTKGISVHTLNKFSIVRNAEKIIALHGGSL